MAYPKITKEEIKIIKSAKAGDKTAFNRIFYKYKEFVEKILYGYIKDEDEARDITNIVFLKIHDKLPTFKDYNSFGGWVRIIANRTAIDYLREIKNRDVISEIEDIGLTLNIPDTSYECDPVNRITYDNILKEIKKLPKDIRRICELYYVENLTVFQISDITKVPVGSIKSILYRAREKLKQKLKT